MIMSTETCVLVSQKAHVYSTTCKPSEKLLLRALPLPSKVSEGYNGYNQSSNHRSTLNRN